MKSATVLRIANRLMPLSVLMMLVGAYIGFIDHAAWSLQLQVIAHINVLLGAVLLKVSYVMHLNASKHLQINDFAPEKGLAERSATESRLPECCMIGKPCM